MSEHAVLTQSGSKADTDVALHTLSSTQAWTPLNITEALTAPRPVIDCVLPGMPIGTVGNLVAPGATGKTQFLIQLAVARSLGLPAMGGLFPAAAPEKVTLLVAEELDVIMRQRLHDVVAWLLGDGLFPVLSRTELVARLQANLTLFPMSGKDVRLVRDGIYTGVLHKLIEVGHGSRLIIADPLRRFHDGDENDSGAMTQLVQGFEHIAQQAGAAVLLAHHTSKAATLNGQGDSQQAGRGSSALTDGVRWQANLTGMPSKTALDLGMPAEEARFHVRFDISKSNYGAPQAPVWLRRLINGVLTCCELPEAEPVNRTKGSKPTRQREIAYV